MAINFDSLPDSYEGNLLKDGWHEATIKSAEMRTPKNGGNDYLNMKLNINGSTVFDSLYESDKPALQFKLKQFIKATGLNLHGNFELSDLTKVITNKTVQVAIITQKNPGYADRNVVDIFKDGGYRKAASDTANTDDLPFAMDNSPFTATDKGAESY